MIRREEMNSLLFLDLHTRHTYIILNRQLYVKRKKIEEEKKRQRRKRYILLFFFDVEQNKEIV